MPTDACQFFYDCKGCGAVLRPRLGDCYVFRSYGDVPCRRSRLHDRVERALRRAVATSPSSAVRASNEG